MRLNGQSSALALSALIAQPISLSWPIMPSPGPLKCVMLGHAKQPRAKNCMGSKGVDSFPWSAAVYLHERWARMPTSKCLSK